MLYWSHRHREKEKTAMLNTIAPIINTVDTAWDLSLSSYKVATQCTKVVLKGAHYALLGAGYAVIASVVIVLCVLELLKERSAPATVAIRLVPMAAKVSELKPMLAEAGIPARGLRKAQMFEALGIHPLTLEAINQALC